ncbi:hypothetical protein AMAG_00661 [Allomyces macrogynus ATCC 38327]|uniref:Peptidyl-prolyl cis-trans isomerase n=1 Tax=Allomyces macrogynus (strain ATCC 38327) TaxID=578462 RepID=A0A0L0RWD5_ALLM3|nr:hypothetical protein AMAG_00661 [Allomyces macrogynus ATCC 38327]|eukprot:KNE54702.1 hypothetical protein AMAG_00661 [Allomyces macrogynus ATCC 38327]
MSVLIETTAGDIVIDLFVDEAPKLSTNFLKLCKVKYFNFHLFFNVQRDLMIQTGDPLANGKGGESIWHLTGDDASPYFAADSPMPRRKHTRKGLVSMALAGVDDVTGTGACGSQWLIATTDHANFLDSRCVVFGEVAEGIDVVDKINDAYADANGRPFQDIRIKHTIILDDPFPDPPRLVVPDLSPDPPRDVLDSVRLTEADVIDDDVDPEIAERERRAREAASHALALEMMGDLPFAEIKPPENVLFVCKLNPVTRDEDLALIFGRFGTLGSCEVIRDKVTGESLCYAFIEYDDRAAAEAAYLKMNNVLIDDRRIKVDFSQSVAKLHRDWTSARRRAGAGFGGFAHLQRRTQYRDEDAPGTSGAPDAAMVFEHDSDLRGGRELASARHERERASPALSAEPSVASSRPRSRSSPARRRGKSCSRSPPPARRNDDRDRDDRHRSYDRERDRPRSSADRSSRDHRSRRDDGRDDRSRRRY